MSFKNLFKRSSNSKNSVVLVSQDVSEQTVLESGDNKIASERNRSKFPGWADTARKYRFFDEGTIVFGDLTPSSAQIEQELYSLDTHWDLQNGNCSELAWELWNSTEDFTISEIFVDRESIHVIALMPDGNYLDSMGIWSRKAILDYWQSVRPDAKITIEDGESGDQLTEPRRGCPVGETAAMVSYLLLLAAGEIS